MKSIEGKSFENEAKNLNASFSQATSIRNKKFSVFLD